MRVRALLYSCLFASLAFSADPALTIYNQQFAVVRETIPLDLKQGVNSIQFDGATNALEPESVMLRDPTGQRTLRILEQNYRADPISLDALLRRYEGQTIEFQIRNGDHVETVSGKIIRAGNTQQIYNGRVPVGPTQSLIEVNGKLQFNLPGTPLFPALGDALLKPVIDWTVDADRAGSVNAELAYVTGGFNWNADYNVIENTGDALSMIGWVTMENRSGKTFTQALIKLMAGDVNKIQPRNGVVGGMGGAVMMGAMSEPLGPTVQEKTFDEYHLYTLQRAVTLHDKETKQVEFVRAEGIKSSPVYIYDGAQIDANRYRNWGVDNIRNDSSYGTQSNPKVWVMREFQNSDANHLGIPLPKGKIRFYRRDTDGRLEFTGEDAIDHKPKDELIRVFTGSAFDLAGERKRTVFLNDMGRRTIDEGFEIKVRNHKTQSVEMRIVEHLYRGLTWDIPSHSDNYAKTDAQTVEFRATLSPNQEKTVTYTAHYTW